MGVNIAQDLEEKKPERPPAKAANSIYPVLNKYSEKTASVKELTTTKLSQPIYRERFELPPDARLLLNKKNAAARAYNKVPNDENRKVLRFYQRAVKSRIQELRTERMHKENTLNKESSTQSTVTHTSKSETEKLVHNESVVDGVVDGQIKKPPVPVKKSPTPTSTVGGLFSGLKNKMLSSSDKTEKTSISISSGSNSSVEGDKTDGLSSSKVTVTTTTTSTFDHVERNSILNDPRAGRVKAPRRRPPSQIMRDDSPVAIGLSNGHEVTPEKPDKPSDKPTDKLADKADKSGDKSSDKSGDKSGDKSEIKPRAREWEKHKAPWMEELKLNQAKKGGLERHRHTSTDRIVDCGVEEKRSTHSMEMSKSTSSISSRISVLESLESSLDKSRNSLEKKDSPPPELPASKPPPLSSPTAAGRTLTTMLDEMKKLAPLASARLDLEKSPERLERIDKVEKNERIEKSVETIVFSEEAREAAGASETASTLDRHGSRDALVAQLNNRITNLEKLLEVQNAKFTAAIEELGAKLRAEEEKRQALQSEMEKLAHCVTQV